MNVEIISRQDKFLAASRGFMIASLVTAALISILGIFAVLLQIEKSNETLLDCIAPYGRCYIEKAAALESNNSMHINAVTIYCSRVVSNASVAEIESCMIKELAR